MTIKTRQEKVEKMIYARLKNIFESQDNLSLDKFAITIIEGFMLLEREDYLKGQNFAYHMCLRT